VCSSDLGLSHAGLRARDELVLGRAHELGIPAVLTLGGGYAEPIEATLEAHANTYRAARQLV
jgi:acetoin utilization deacetylase AcuC-like enzyme